MERAPTRVGALFAACAGEIAAGWVRRLDRHGTGIQMIDAVEQTIERMLQVLLLIRRPMRLVVVVGIW